MRVGKGEEGRGRKGEYERARESMRDNGEEASGRIRNTGLENVPREEEG